MTMPLRFCVLLAILPIWFSGCSQSESPPTPSSADASNQNQAVPEPAPTLEPSGPFERRVVISPFVLQHRTLALATPFAMQQIEAPLDVSLEELEQTAAPDSPEKIAVDAIKLILADAPDGLVEMASDDSHAGNVKFYAALGKQFSTEPKPLARYDLAHHTCVVFEAGGGPIPGIAIPLKQVDDGYKLFVTDRSESIQQFHFHLVNDVLMHPEAAAPIPKSSTQISFTYKHPAASDPLKLFVTRIAKITDDGSLALPDGVGADTASANAALKRHFDFWGRFDGNGFDAIKDDIHPDRLRWFRKPDDRHHHPYDNLHNSNQDPTYTLKPEWIAWTDHVWAIGITVNKFVTPDASPTSRTVIELFVTDPEIGEPRYWGQAASYISDMLTDAEVAKQINEYLEDKS